MFPLFYLFLQIAIEMEVPSSNASYTSRALAMVILALLFFYSFRNGRLKAKWSIFHLSLLLFMVLYGFRIFLLNDEATWKLDSEHYPFFKVSMLFIFGSIAPFVLAMFSAKLFVQKSTSNTFIFLTFVSVIVVAVMNIDQFGVFRTSGFQAGSIASLSMGYLAALAVGYCLLDFLRLKRFPWILLCVVLACAIFLLSVSASRGPMLATLVSSLYILATMRKTALNLTLSAVGLIVIVAGSLWFFNYSGSGIAIIENNFLFGRDIALSNGFWPHNYVIEAFMAVGMFGFLLLIPWIFAILKVFVEYKSDDSQWLYLWFIQTSVMNMFTEAIWSGSSLFVCLCLILGSGSGKQSRKKRRRRRRRKSSNLSLEHA
jgi:hypothetical protein